VEHGAWIEELPPVRDGPILCDFGIGHRDLGVFSASLIPLANDLAPRLIGIGSSISGIGRAFMLPLGTLLRPRLPWAQPGQPWKNCGTSRRIEKWLGTLRREHVWCCRWRALPRSF
jgi:hypothetical protein